MNFFVPLDHWEALDYYSQNNSAASNTKTEFTLPHSSKNTYPFDRMAPSGYKLICKEFLPTWITLKSIKKPLPTFFLVFAILFMLFTALITCIWQHRLSWKIMLYPIFWSRVQAFPELSELFLNSFNIRFFTSSIITYVKCSSNNLINGLREVHENMNTNVSR